MRSGCLVLFILVFAFVMIGCEGEVGPQGPAGPEGPEGAQGPAGEDGQDGQGVYEFTYLGNGGEDCMHCHMTTVSNWSGTKHYEAYADLDSESKENPYCVKCHVTGWDSEVAYGDTVINVYGPDTTGFDDYWMVETDEAEERRMALAGVQCEACHGGMGPDFNAHRPNISFATHNDEDGESLSLCSPCHSTQLNEWVESGHAAVQASLTPEQFTDEFGRSSCNPCHTSEGFLAANDPAYATYEFDELQSYIGCVTCHDPHSNTYEAQVRTVGAVETVYHPGYEDGDPEVATMDGYGVGQVCAQCHHGRRDADNVDSQIADGYAHFGPHGSPQMDTYIGTGCYEIEDFVYEGSHAHQSISNGCVSCHMEREAIIHGELQDHSFHSFTPDADNCLPCHSIEDFDYNGVQTEVMDKLDQLAQALGYTDRDDFEANFDSQADGVTADERMIAYAMVFILNDGSYGVHNPTYVMDLLDNAISYSATLP